MTRKSKNMVLVRPMTAGDLPAVAAMSRQIYPRVPWTIEELSNLHERFAPGQLVAVEHVDASPAADADLKSAGNSAPPPSQGGAGGGPDRSATLLEKENTIEQNHADGNDNSVAKEPRNAPPSPSPSLKGRGDSSNLSDNQPLPHGRGSVLTSPVAARVVGFAASLIIRWDEYEFTSSWHDMTEGGTFNNHDPEHGRTLYGVEVMVDPTMQGRGIGKLLYEARRELCRSLNLKRIRGGARLANYHLHEKTMSLEEYVIAVVNGEIGDPTLSFQLRQGFRVLDIVRDYMPRDTDSGGHAAVIEWINHRVAARSDYRRRDPRFGKRRKRKEDG